MILYVTLTSTVQGYQLLSHEQSHTVLCGVWSLLGHLDLMTACRLVHWKSHPGHHAVLVWGEVDSLMGHSNKLVPGSVLSLVHCY